METDGQESRARRVVEAAIRFEQMISAALVIVILALVVMQVVARYVLKDPFVWTEELARFGLIWLTFIGTAFVMARGRHIAIDVVSQPLSPKGRMALDIVSSLMTIAAAVVFLPASLNFAIAMNRVGSPAADIPMSFVYAAGLVGFSLLALHCLLRLVFALLEGPQGYEDEDVGSHLAGNENS